MSAAPNPSVSPFARAALELIGHGYHVLPIMPLEKAPGEYRGGQWRRMSQWQRFRDKAPSEFEAGLWSRNYPDANIGIVLGSPAGAGMRLVAVDIDTVDPDAFADILSALPYSPMVKRGAKGETRFYRAPITIKSKPYDDTRSGGRTRLVDILTGQDTRQTVVPPSVHVSAAGTPSGHIYAWLSGPVAAHELPVFGEDELTVLEETLSGHGWDPKGVQREHPKARPVDGDEDDYFGETKLRAMADLAAWVPALDLYNCRPARGGYEAVASWRPSSTGRPLEQRKRNLSIQANGIKDFGTNDTYSSIDLVMAARSVERSEAVEWLRNRLGFSKPEPMLLQARVAQEFPSNLNATEIQPDPAKPLAEELPDALTRLPGLLGEVTDWICDSAMQPQRGLALGAALTIIGTAAGRKYAGPTRTGTQLYVMALAASGSGKDHAYKAVGRVLEAATLGQHLGPSFFMSISALHNRVSRHPLSLCAMDEFGAFMAKMKNTRGSTHEQMMPGYLRTLWSSSFSTVPPIEWAGRESKPIYSPCLSMYGVSTHDEFYKALGGGDISNGFLNRFLLISTRLVPDECDPAADPHEVPDSIKAALKSIYGAGIGLIQASSHLNQADPPLFTVPWGPGAKAIYDDLRKAMRKRQEDAFFARTAEMAQRVATIRAIGQSFSAPVITVEDMTWARDLALWSAERMLSETCDHISETTDQGNAKMILRIIGENPGISRRDVGRKVQKKFKGREIDEIIKELLVTEEVREERRRPDAGGPETRLYWRQKG